MGRPRHEFLISLDGQISRLQSQFLQQLGHCAARLDLPRLSVDRNLHVKSLRWDDKLVLQIRRASLDLSSKAGKQPKFPGTLAGHDLSNRPICPRLTDPDKESLPCSEDFGLSSSVP